ncbi:hypothetical protein GCM10012283_22670 [Phycicoccus endophyticus]|nr:hypothetical protein GCM10012283_22670 [Phycicoccus endophyticus]
MGAGLVLAAMGVMAVTGCGSEQNPQAATSAASAASAAGSSSPAASDAALEDRATAMLLPEGSLGDGWRLSDPPQPGFRMTICGVDIEPEQPRGVALRRFAQSGLGPFVVQYVEVHRDGLADEVVSALREALPGCTRFSSTGEAADSPEESFVVDEVRTEDVPEDTVVVRMTSQGEHQVTQDIAFVARGEFLVGLVSFVGGRPPDPGVIETALAHVPAAS